MYGVIRAGRNDSSGPTVSGEALLALSREEFDDRRCIEECKHLMRSIISHQLGHHQLQSRNLLGTFKT